MYKETRKTNEIEDAFVDFMLSSKTDCQKAFNAGIEAEKNLIKSKTKGGYELISRRLCQLRMLGDKPVLDRNIDELCNSAVSLINGNDGFYGEERHEQLLRAALYLLEAVDYAMDDYASLNSRECPNCHRILKPEEMGFNEEHHITMIQCKHCGKAFPEHYFIFANQTI